MTNGESLGGLLGTALALGFILWGADKMTGALDSKKGKGEPSFLDNTEPF